MTDSRAAWAVAAWAWAVAAEVTTLARELEWVAEVEWEVAWAVAVAWAVVDRRDATTTTVAKAVACRCVIHTCFIAPREQYNVSSVACTCCCCSMPSI